MTNGFLLVDKPIGFTSHDVVALVRRGLGERRVGHAGTLDPAATGLLILGVGRSTRLLTFFVGADKRYEAVIRLGMATDTDDAEGSIVQCYGASHVEDKDIALAIRDFTGEIAQVPSTVSAIKVAGKPAHRRVRAGETVKLAERSITVHSFDVDAVTRRDVDGVSVVDIEAEVHVSSGTYVRALARDLGRQLGCGGHLIGLRRTRVGPFDVSESFSQVLDLKHGSVESDPVSVGPCAPVLRDFLVSSAAIASRALPVTTIPNDEARAVLHGQRIASRGESSEPTALISESGELLAVAEAIDGMWRYRVVVGEQAGRRVGESKSHPSGSAVGELLPDPVGRKTDE
jgi:tRNA pseudouridine55 synthase